MHCEDPGCLKACPAPGAIVQYTNGIVDFHEENCIGCGYCVTGCPFNIPRISKRDHRAYKCTLCSDRVAVGQGPVGVGGLGVGDSVGGAFAGEDAAVGHGESPYIGWVGLSRGTADGSQEASSQEVVATHFLGAGPGSHGF